LAGYADPDGLQAWGKSDGKVPEGCSCPFPM
jgi:hypothetical protein